MILFAGVDFPKVIARPDTAYFRNDVMRHQIGVGRVPEAVSFEAKVLQAQAGSGSGDPADGAVFFVSGRQASRPGP